MRKNFLGKSYTKCAGENFSGPFSKKSKLSISLDQYSKFYKVCFDCMPSSGLSKYFETKPQITCF